MHSLSCDLLYDQFARCRGSDINGMFLELGNAHVVSCLERKLLPFDIDHACAFENQKLFDGIQMYLSRDL